MALAGCHAGVAPGRLRPRAAVRNDGVLDGIRARHPGRQTLPGTDIKYIGKTEQGAQMTIGGQQALKRALDSLTWRGQVAPGVTIDYNLRVITFDSQSLQAGGTAKVVVSDSSPKPCRSRPCPRGAHF